MTPVKVIVQGLSLRSDASGHEEVCNKGYKKKLERVLAMYGPVRCTYLWADETHSSPPPDIIDNFAHVYYKNEEDAVRASQAASNHEVQLDDCILTLTLVSRSLISIDILDNDCLLQIFSKLDLEDRLRIEEVCPHWKELAQHSWSSMKRLDLEFVSVTEAQFETYLIKCGEYLEELVCKIVSAYSIALITTHCENLKALDLTIYSTFSNHTASLSQMLKKFDNLISFKCDHSISTAYNMFEDLPSSIKELSVICRYWQPTGVIRVTFIFSLSLVLSFSNESQ
uniref:C02F5.7_1 protein n=1 Tax=Fopius arisanus TaxID=64838 RepID=A0A0C9RWE0_9HYME